MYSTYSSIFIDNFPKVLKHEPAISQIQVVHLYLVDGSPHLLNLSNNACKFLVKFLALIPTQRY